MRPGLTTATQYSGAPLPLPIRVSAGFFVTGLSGNIRIQTLPPRLMWRVIAIRAASIWRSVIHAGSRLLSPYSPKLISLPRVATPVMRPRICFRCLTFFGINITIHLFRHKEAQKSHEQFCAFCGLHLCAFCVLLVFRSRSASVGSTFTFAAGTRATLALTCARLIDRIGTGATRHRGLRIENLAAIDPNLHTNLPKRRLRFGETVVDISAQSVEGKLSLQVPLTACDFSAVQTTTDLDLVDLRALAADDDSRSRGVDDDLQAIRGPFDIDVRHARARKALLEIAFQLQIFKQELAKLLFGKP